MTKFINRNNIPGILFLILILASGNLFAADSTMADRPYYKITIETESYSLGQLIDTVDISIESSGKPIGGVDIKIGFDSPALEIIEIIPGEIPDSCRWKFFNTRDVSFKTSVEAPTGVWQILAMAEFGGDTVRAVCYGFDRKASIAKLIIHVDSSKLDLETDSMLQIFFYWEDCGDNTVTNISGDSLYLSAELNDKKSAPGALPSRIGAPASCINPKAQNKPVRGVGFESGGVVVNSDNQL
ncbi:MAG: hypothetical protein IIC66_10625 [candidate division Zixibacteria bacterium]|nr:hypothetical protein [candidate division Zixibacteria bacterium]